MGEVKPIAIPGIHKRFLAHFLAKEARKDLKILDVGAGHGAFSKTLHEMGYEVHACDLFPEIFYYDQIECRKADLTQPLPYEDNSFDVLIAIEVMEHILDHEVFFAEARRILKPGGRLYISTPNILSLKSRMRFLLSGFYYSFKPLDLHNNDGLQHVASLTLDQYHYLGIRAGLRLADVSCDRYQSTSRWLMWLYPFMWLQTRLQKIAPIHNTRTLLLGRIVFLTFLKAPEPAQSAPR
ncbi:MAG: class I SAM-dependent methyltransferase [Bacteroidetes bacterium]|nr:MAG: class I SAM-dependent methyltransferase [Bacteroidota bacterium]